MLRSHCILIFLYNWLPWSVACFIHVLYIWTFAEHDCIFKAILKWIILYIITEYTVYLTQAIKHFRLHADIELNEKTFHVAKLMVTVEINGNLYSRVHERYSTGTRFKYPFFTTLPKLSQTMLFSLDQFSYKPKSQFKQTETLKNNFTCFHCTACLYTI